MSETKTRIRITGCQQVSYNTDAWVSAETLEEIKQAIKEDDYGELSSIAQGLVGTPDDAEEIEDLEFRLVGENGKPTGRPL